MDNTPHIKYTLPDRSYSSSVKKEIHRLAESLGLSRARLSEADIIVSEIISNLNKHAAEGEVLVKVFKDLYGRTGLELISIDRGPGMKNPVEMLVDGYSTTHTLGQGLGAIKRLSDEFDIYSIPEWGTILLSRIIVSKGNSDVRKPHFGINALMLPKSGETLCGDGWIVKSRGADYKFIALDGLGHGPQANFASSAAIDEFLKIDQNSPAEIIRILHQRIRKTRGAVGMVVHANRMSNVVSYAGLGNISARILGRDKNKSCISYNGIIGHSIPNTMHTNQAAFNRNDIMIVYSDGLKSRWDIAHLPDILNHDGSVIAAALYREFSRNTDDVLVIVIKNK